jgi:hypothetical protein
MSLLEKLLDVAFEGIDHPISRYREVKKRIAHDLVLYADAIMLNEDGPVVPATRQARQRANRGRAAELEMATKNLPAWYRKLLHTRGEEPSAAAKNLRDLAAATSTESADRCVENVEQCLRF